MVLISVYSIHSEKFPKYYLFGIFWKIIYFSIFFPMTNLFPIPLKDINIYNLYFIKNTNVYVNLIFF